jgi:hypothetical protein
LSKYTKPTQEQWDQVAEILNSGGTKVSAAEEVLGSKTKESTIRSAIKRGDVNLKVTTSTEVVMTPEVLEELCGSEDWNLASLAKKLRNAQRTNTQLRKVQRDIFDEGSDDTEGLTLQQTMDTLVPRLEGKMYKHVDVKPEIDVKGKTVEILFSDLQIGKISENWDTPTAIRTLKYYGEEVLKIVQRVKPEKILFSSLGDVCECALKHGMQSAISTDTGNSEQMANAIEHVWFSVLAPLIATNIPLHFVGIQGNHLSSMGKGMDMFKAGRYGYDYAIYRTWQNMCTIIGANHVTFDLPEGHFTTYEIYGKVTLLEHGYGHNSSEVGMLKHKDKRANNLKKYIDRYVCGDMHHECMYDNGNLVINGAFFGVAYEAIEYSGILGFHSVPCQAVLVHEATTGVGQSTVVEKLTIQTAKGY